MAEHLKLTEETLAAIGTLYKYRDAKSEWNWAVLENQELWFPNPTTFNDPFDANIGMRYDLLPAEVINEMVEQQVKSMHPTAGYHLLQGEMRRLRERLLNPETHDDAMQRWMQRLTSKMRVFCICPDRDNILLWSHYANNHTGFAVGFDAMQLHALWKTNQGFQMGYVAYRDTYPILLPALPGDNHTKEDIITTIMNVKSDIWAYEKEIRMNMFDGPAKASFAPTLIKEVVIGCKMAADDQRKMLEVMDRKYPHACVYRARLRRSAFALDFDKLRG